MAKGRKVERAENVARYTFFTSSRVNFPNRVPFVTLQRFSPVERGKISDIAKRSRRTRSRCIADSYADKTGPRRGWATKIIHLFGNQFNAFATLGD